MAKNRKKARAVKAPPDIGIAARKLDAIGAITAPEREAFLATLDRTHVVKAGSDIVADGSQLKSSICIIDGLACRYKFLSGGRRQITAIQFGGDISGYVLNKIDYALGALTDCTVATIPHDKIRKLTVQFPNFALIVWRDTLIEGAILRSWLTGIGRKSALSRVAHFFCEQLARMKAVGLATGNSARLGVTQQDLADAMGLSLVHTNRVLQELRQANLMEFKSKTLTIINLKKLQKLGEFDPAYLQLRKV